MNKKKLYKSYETLVMMLSNERIGLIYKAIELFSPLTELLKNEPLGVLNETNNSQQRRAVIRNKIETYIKDERKLEYRKIIVQSYELEDFLRSFKSSLKDNRTISYIEVLQKNLDDFLSRYEKHTRAYSTDSFLSLSFSALELKNALIITKQIISSILKTQDLASNNRDLHQLELYLSNVTSLKNFAAKLDAIHDIYTEILHLYGFSETDCPIVIEHIENGSLWVKVAGHTLTATLLTTVLSSATNYYQEHFTVSGQIKQLPASVHIVNELLKISETLEKDGVDTSEINDHINSATKKISRKLDVLLGDQPIVEINEKEHNIGEVLSDKLIEQSAIKQIDHIENIQ